MARKCTHLLIYGTNECLIYLWQSFSLCLVCSVSLSLSRSLSAAHSLTCRSSAKGWELQIVVRAVAEFNVACGMTTIYATPSWTAGEGGRVGGRRETGSLPAYAAHIIRIASPKRGHLAPLPHFSSLLVPAQLPSAAPGAIHRLGARLNGESYFLARFDWQFISI